MGELELVGLHEDGEHLVLQGADGQRFRLRIDEPLRAAVRRDRPQLEQLRAERYGTLAPREIQARIRAGQTAAAVAEGAGVPIEMVRRYEGPVLAEREHVARQARVTRVGRDAGAPVLGDLVTDRLAARGVALDSIGWDAFREGTSPWTVVVRFTVHDEQREALWTFDAQTRAVQALEDEARWLSETELADEVIPRRHLAAVRDVVFDVGADGAVRPVTPIDDDLLLAPDAPPASEPDPGEATAALLDDLRTKRGVRQQLDEEDLDVFEGFGPQRTFDFPLPDEPPAAHPAASAPETATDAQVLPRPSRPSKARRILTDRSSAPAPDETAVPTEDSRAGSAASPEPAAPAPPTAAPATAAPVPAAAAVSAAPAASSPAERPRSRRGRPSVPSWDEIVFGAKPE